MKFLQKRLACFVLILFVLGCGAGIKTVITSDPPGARIYWGNTPDNMSYAGITPMTFWNTLDKPYWKEHYYQIKKVGYEDSELIFKTQGAIGADRFVHAMLKPSGESVVYVKEPFFLFSKPSILGEKLGLMEKGTKLTIIDIKETWYKVQSPSFGMGWISSEFVVDDASEIEKTEQIIKPLEPETKPEDEKLKPVVYLNIDSYIYSEPNFEGTELIFLDKGTKFTVLDTKDNWTKVQSQYFEAGWIQTNRVIADADEIEKGTEKKVTDNKEIIRPLKSETKSEDENEKCEEIKKLSTKLMSLITTHSPVPDNFHFDWGTKAYHPPIQSRLSNYSKINGISLRILGLMEELHSTGSDKQVADCNQLVHLLFIRKATVSFSGKGLIDREDARIKYKITAKAPAILQIDFTVFPASTEIMSYGFLIMSESPLVTYPSTHVEFKGVMRDYYYDFMGRLREKWVKATQFVCDKGMDVVMAGMNMMMEPYSSIPFNASVELPVVQFFSNKRPLPSYPTAYPLDFNWSPIHLTEQDLQKAFEKGRLILKRKTETESASGTVIIDFAPPDPELLVPAQSNPGGIGLWGDRTTHGGFLLATEKSVFIDGHPVAKEGDPVLCPIHGLTKVSRDESSGVYIGDKTVSFEGCKADCGAKIMSGNPLVVVEPVKQ